MSAAVAAPRGHESHILTESNYHAPPKGIPLKANGHTLPFQYHANLKVVPGNGEFTSKLVAAVPFKAGQVIAKIDGAFMNTAKTYTSVQCGVDRHLELNSDLVYSNHSCNPNALLDMEERELRAVRDIPAGEDITWFYPSTEWSMSQPFVCWCGAPQCIKMVGGAKYLSAAQLGRYFVNKHIREHISKHLESIHHT